MCQEKKAQDLQSLHEIRKCNWVITKALLTRQSCGLRKGGGSSNSLGVTASSFLGQAVGYGTARSRGKHGMCCTSFSLWVKNSKRNSSWEFPCTHDQLLNALGGETILLKCLSKAKAKWLNTKTLRNGRKKKSMRKASACLSREWVEF